MTASGSGQVIRIFFFIFEDLPRMSDFGRVTLLPHTKGPDKGQRALLATRADLLSTGGVKRVKVLLTMVTSY